MVGQDLSGWTVLDAFGGSGLLAFESVSRGADRVTVVERNGRAAAAIRAAAGALGVRIDLRVQDASSVLGTATWDLVLLDPPYADDAAVWAERASTSVRRVLVVEHSKKVSLPETLGHLVLDRVRRHGDSALSIYRPGSLSGSNEMDVVGDDLAVVEDEG